MVISILTVAHFSPFLNWAWSSSYFPVSEKFWLLTNPSAFLAYFFLLLETEGIRQKHSLWENSNSLLCTTCLNVSQGHPNDATHECRRGWWMGCHVWLIWWQSRSCGPLWAAGTGPPKAHGLQSEAVMGKSAPGLLSHRHQPAGKLGALRFALLRGPSCCVTHRHSAERSCCSQ